MRSISSHSIPASAGAQAERSVRGAITRGSLRAGAAALVLASLTTGPGTSAAAQNKPPSASAAPAMVFPSEQCDTETMQQLAPADTTIGFAAREGQICRVGGYVTTRNPGPNRVLFALALPNTFNGRYVYLGVGGAGGQLPVLNPSLLERGFVLAGSDAGSGAKSGNDYRFQSDPAKSLDYAYRGVRVTAAATQQITRAYYQRETIHRYISGCSAGGVMGMTNARRFGGADFDGFLIGASPWPGSLYPAFAYRVVQHLQTHPDGWISPELLGKAQAAIVARYDGADGFVDGIVADQRTIGAFDVGILRELGFTPAQIVTFDMIRTPMRIPVNWRGNGIQPPFPVATMASWPAFLTGRMQPPWPDSTQMSPIEQAARGVPFSHVLADTRTRATYPGKSYVDVRDPKELVRIAWRDGKDQAYEDPMDFGVMASGKAKMVFYHGVDDQAISYLESLSAYETLMRRFPNSSSWLRAFMIPGLQHCAGGKGPTDVSEPLLDTLIDWVENGKAPSQVALTRRSRDKGLERDFLACAEPQRVRFDAAGKASCVAPPPAAPGK